MNKTMDDAAHQFTSQEPVSLDALDRAVGRATDALLAMNYDNPVHRPILDAEGLKRWLPPHVDGYAALREAAAQQGFFQQQLAKSA